MTAARICRAGGSSRRIVVALACLGACAAAWLACALPLAAQSSNTNPRPSDYQVKAQYLSYFGRYVEWTTRGKPAPEEPFEICILGQDPFGAALDAAVNNENINGAPLLAKRIAHAQDAASCRILYISASEAGQLDSLIGTLATSSVLTVSDLPDFAKRGGMIQFILDGNFVRFEVNLAAALKARLRLSSQLLKLARTVRTP